jgi:DNA uptake protein ComE-like DNA-binding protein
MASAAAWAADETLAAIEGFVEGWFRPSPQAVNVNSASARQLEGLPGVTAEDAHRIIRSRPYDEKRELLKKHAISEDAYARIRDQIKTK